METVQKEMNVRDPNNGERAKWRMRTNWSWASMQVESQGLGSNWYSDERSRCMTECENKNKNTFPPFFPWQEDEEKDPSENAGTIKSWFWEFLTIRVLCHKMLLVNKMVNLRRYIYKQ
jgi:hypothetical protein